MDNLIENKKTKKQTNWTCASSAAVETLVEKEPESSNTVNRNKKLKTENEIADSW